MRKLTILSLQFLSDMYIHFSLHHSLLPTSLRTVDSAVYDCANPRSLFLFLVLINDRKTNKRGNPHLHGWLYSGKSTTQQGNQNKEVIVQRVQLETARTLTHQDRVARRDGAELKRQHLDCRIEEGLVVQRQSVSTLRALFI